MADMNFGVNILPNSDSSKNLGSSTKKWSSLYANSISGSAVYNSLDKQSSGSALDARQGKVLNDKISLLPCLIINCGTVSSLPVTINNTQITSDMKCIDVNLSNPWAESDDWTATTANGSVTISGTTNGSTDVTLYLMKTR